MQFTIWRWQSPAAWYPQLRRYIVYLWFIIAENFTHKFGLDWWLMVFILVFYKQVPNSKIAAVDWLYQLSRLCCEGLPHWFCFKNDKVMLFGNFCTFSRNRRTAISLQQGGISDFGYFFHQIFRRKGRSQSTKVTEHSIFVNSSGTHVLSQGVWIDMASATAAALCETFWTASKNLTLL